MDIHYSEHELTVFIMEEKILGLFHKPDYTPLNVSELLARLGLSRKEQRELERLL